MGNLRKGEHLKDLGINGRIRLKSTFKNWEGEWTEFIWLGKGHAAGFCECTNAPSGSTKCGEILDQL
jgi:hypothetical protein